MSQRYDDSFKKEVVQAYIRGDKSASKLSAEYNVAASTILDWVKKYGEECQYTTANNDNDAAKEIRRLNQELREKEKEIAFLKKAAAFFAKEID